jgi:hypothetical protein
METLIHDVKRLAKRNSCGCMLASYRIQKELYPAEIQTI